MHRIVAEKAENYVTMALGADSTATSLICRALEKGKDGKR